MSNRDLILTISSRLILLGVRATADAQTVWPGLSSVYARPGAEVAQVAGGVGELYWTRLEQFSGLYDEDKRMLLENSRKGSRAAEGLPHAIRKSSKTTVAVWLFGFCLIQGLRLVVKRAGGRKEEGRALS